MSLREDLKLDNPIPADYNVPYFVHQDDLNKLDQSHKRVERWLAILCIIIFVALIGTNAYWIWYEHSYQDVIVTETTQDGDGVNAIGASGDISYGPENQGSENESKEEW